MKSGRGFYDWLAERLASRELALTRHLVAQLPARERDRPEVLLDPVLLQPFLAAAREEYESCTQAAPPTPTAWRSSVPCTCTRTGTGSARPPNAPPRISQRPTAMDEYKLREAGWPLNLICYLERRAGVLCHTIAAWSADSAPLTIRSVLGHRGRTARTVPLDAGYRAAGGNQDAA